MNIAIPANIWDVCWLEFNQPLTYSPIENEYEKLKYIEIRKAIK